jgi:N-glycosylase/DNA lyase
MILKNENLDLAAIADSGQCFRWVREEDGTFRITAMGQVLRARQLSETTCDLDCDRASFDRTWRSYLDLDTDYGAVIRRIPERDRYLSNAARFGRGIRILRQDPWETLITFTISQRKNIPAIRQAVEKICDVSGKQIPGEKVHAFPTVRELASLSLEELEACSLGYRAKYLYGEAECFASGKMQIGELEQEDSDALYDSLLFLPGVGVKIANCTMLFGFHRLERFPVDVWMNRIQERHYPDGYPLDAWGKDAGILQQYMFAFERAQDGVSGLETRKERAMREKKQKTGQKA